MKTNNDTPKALEVPNEIPADLKTGRGKVKAQDTAEGVIGGMDEIERDPTGITEELVNV